MFGEVADSIKGGWEKIKGGFSGGDDVSGGGVLGSILQFLVIVCILIVIFVIIWGVIVARKVAKQINNVLPDDNLIANAYNNIEYIIANDDQHPQLQHLVGLVRSGRMSIYEFFENLKAALSNLDVKNSVKLSKIRDLIAQAQSTLPVAGDLSQASVPLNAAPAPASVTQNEIIYNGNLPRPRAGDCAGREDLVKEAADEADALAVADGNVAPYQENMVSNNAARRAKLTDAALRYKLEQ